MRRWMGGLLMGAVGLVGVAGCGDDDTEDADTAGSDAESEALSGTIQVLAAASLTDAFEEVAAAFEAEHPDVTVTLSFGGSSALAQQVLDGAPADVLATADQRTMDEVVTTESTAAEPEVFARNRLTLAVPSGNPGAVHSLDDLADGDRFVGLCAVEVRCGSLADQLLTDEGVEASVDTYEPDVRALLTKLEAGELDVGLVYETDALAADDTVDVVELSGVELPATTYPVAALTTGENQSVGEAFVAFVLSEEGRSLLTDHGFRSP